MGALVTSTDQSVVGALVASTDQSVVGALVASTDQSVVGSWVAIRTVAGEFVGMSSSKIDLDKVEENLTFLLKKIKPLFGVMPRTVKIL